MTSSVEDKKIKFIGDNTFRFKYKFKMTSSVEDKKIKFIGDNTFRFSNTLRVIKI